MTVRTSPRLSLARHPITRIAPLITTYAQTPALYRVASLGGPSVDASEADPTGKAAEAFPDRLVLPGRSC